MEKQYFKILLMALAVFFFSPLSASSQKFLHPGIDQTQADMAYMKKQVLAGEQPWKAAFERLKSATDLQFQVKPYTHVLRGPYGRPNIGGDDLSKGSNMAYNCALMGYLTGNLIHYNQGFGITSFAGKNIKSAKNTFAGNGKDLKSNEKISSEKFINMQ